MPFFWLKPYKVSKPLNSSIMTTVTLVYRSKFLSTNKKDQSTRYRYIYTVVGKGKDQYIEDCTNEDEDERYAFGSLHKDTGEPLHYSYDGTLNGRSMTRDESDPKWYLEACPFEQLNAYKEKYPNLDINTIKEMIALQSKAVKEAAK